MHKRKKLIKLADATEDSWDAIQKMNPKILLWKMKMTRKFAMQEPQLTQKENRMKGNSSSRTVSSIIHQTMRAHQIITFSVVFVSLLCLPYVWSLLSEALFFLLLCWLLASYQQNFTVVVVLCKFLLITVLKIIFMCAITVIKMKLYFYYIFSSCTLQDISGILPN